MWILCGSYGSLWLPMRQVRSLFQIDLWCWFPHPPSSHVVGWLNEIYYICFVTNLREGGVNLVHRVLKSMCILIGSILCVLLLWCPSKMRDGCCNEFILPWQIELLIGEGCMDGLKILFWMLEGYGDGPKPGYSAHGA
jgi:hypothetical protein